MYIVITGASRGIGLELTRQGLEKGHKILAVVRKPSDELKALKNKHNDLFFCEADLSHPDAPAKVLQSCEQFPCVDVLINNAGIYMENDSREDFMNSFMINSVAPYFLTMELKNKLKLSKRPVSAQITSMMGSIGDNSSGGAYSYRSSKAALNMIFKSVSVDLNWLTVLQFHPGWVQTRMGGANAPVTPEVSAKGLWKLIDDATLSGSGTFMDFQGKKISW